MLRYLVKSGLGGVISQIITFATLPIISRLYDPTSVNLWILSLTTIIITGSLTCFRYELAIVVEKKLKFAVKLLLSCLIISAFTTCIFGIILHIPLISEKLFQSGDKKYTLKLIVIGIYIYNVNVILQNWNIRQNKYGVISIAEIIKVLTTCLLQLYFGLFNKSNGDYLIFSSVIGLSLSLLILCIGLDKNIFKWIKLKRSNLKYILYKYRQFLQYSTLYTIVFSISGRGILYAFNLFIEPKLVATFALLERVLNAPVNLLTSAIRPVLFNEASRSNIKTIQKKVEAVLYLLIYFASPCVLIFLKYSVNICNLLLGAQYPHSAEYAKVIIFMPVSFLLVNWIDRLYDVCGLQKLMLKMQCVSTTIIITSILCLLHLKMSFLLCLIALTVCTTLYNLVFILVLYNVVDWSSKVLLGKLFPVTLYWILIFFLNKTIFIVRIYYIPTSLGIILICITFLLAFLKTAVSQFKILKQ